MTEKKSRKLFDTISPYYNRFYDRQRQNYARIIKLTNHCNLSHFSSILDVGCGTGAMASVFSEMGLETYAVDHSIGMLRVAKNRRENASIRLNQATTAGGLPFPENCFDVVMAAFVAHGMTAGQRLILYSEMKRVGKHLVILHDYNGVRSLGTSIAEFAEGGDYFNFIRVVKSELMDFFGNLEVVETDKRSCCYICNIG